MRIAGPLLLCAMLAGGEVALCAPLATRIAGEHPGGPARLSASLTIPAGAPADLGCAVWVSDRHGRWWQRILAHRLAPGSHRLSCDLDATSALRPEGHRGAWDACAAASIRSGGILLWSAGSGGRISVDAISFSPLTPTATETPRLILLGQDPWRTTCGTRWEARWRIVPAPADPWDPLAPAVRLTASRPGAALAVSGFRLQPMRHTDRGDREELTPEGEAVCATRLRATRPGGWKLNVAATWPDGRSAQANLPPLVATGPASDPIVRVDAADPRFFSVDARPVWPLGPNLHSIWDVRARDRVGSRLTTDRGSLSYLAWFDRLAAAGATAAEIWLCSWNLALEWRADWAPWRGAGAYSDERAWQLDRVLDLAEARGLRINLVINNHGQVSAKNDPEWRNNPLHREAGGWLDDAARAFDDPRALAMQERYRRYLVARYGDSPAVLGWKLWSEVNLTELGRQTGGNGPPAGRQAAQALLRGWHERAAADFASCDPWRHPVTTHWAGNYTVPDRAICAMPGIGYICIDAYHQEDGPPLWLWLNRSTADPAERKPSGLSPIGKPVLVTEYGGNWNGAPEAQLDAAVRIGPWVALVSGHAGAPMFWWHEWLDARDLFGPYRAVARFLAAEDLRGAARSCAVIQATAPAANLWARAWHGPGRMLGYVLDQEWGRRGGDGADIAAGSCVLGDNLRAGAMRLAWWDADSGEVVAEERIDHPGGRLAAAMPAFRRHLAFKAWRE